MLRPATDDDWEAVTGTAAPGQWFGLVEARPHLVEGLGAVYADVDGKWWVMFCRCPGIRKTKSAHAAARKLFALARDRGVVVHAMADPAIRGAQMWIEKLGFSRTDETREGIQVWALKC